jgi:uncharacterized protein YkuJ
LALMNEGTAKKKQRRHRRNGENNCLS